MTAAKRVMRELRLGGKTGRLDGGLNAADLPHTLDSSQSPCCRNVWFYEGTITKRPGQRLAGALDAGTQIGAAIKDGGGKFVLQCGAALYRMEPEGGTYEAVGALQTVDGAVPPGFFYRYGDRVYFLNGRDFLVSTGGVFSAVEPTVPTVLSGRSPTGITPGTAGEERNALTAAYKIAFSGDGSSTVYSIPRDFAVSSAAVTVRIGDTEMTEGAGFTVNRTSRAVTFSSAPPAGVNNVVFTLTGEGDGEALLSCRHAAVYAGESRVLLGGNGTNVLFYSKPYEPEYFPVGNRLSVGNQENITGFGRQYDLLAVFKAGETDTVSFRPGQTPEVRVLNPVIGCDIPGSIQSLDNRIVFANTVRGVCIVVSTGRENERNILAVSRNIDPLLFKEDGADLQSAAACCFEGRYWLCIGSHVYVWDSVTRPLGGGDEESLRRLAWYYFEGISAAAWLTAGRQLYYAASASAAGHSGAVVRLVRQFDDFGQPVKALWRSAALDFGKPEMYKATQTVWFIMRGGFFGDTRVRYLYDEKRSDVSVCEPVNLKISAFDWSLFRWHGFSWDVPGYFRTFTRRPRRKRVLFFSVELESDAPSCDLALADIIIRYKYEQTIK